MNSHTQPYLSLAGLHVDAEFAEFVQRELLPLTSLEPTAFWADTAELINTFAPRNKALLAKRQHLQQKIDNWHLEHKNEPFDAQAYKQFLEGIGYLVPPVEPFSIDTQNIDDEIATLAGPQLVVPVMNARFALNACNARWGSLYDALYGTDAIEPLNPTQTGYDKARGAKVVAYGREFLNNTLPLSKGNYFEATGFTLKGQQLIVTLSDGEQTPLANPQQFKGLQGDLDALDSNRVVLLENNGLHVEIILDNSHPIGKTDRASICDIVVESALTTIMDCEDSVAAVDAADKILVYRNWLGLMQGSLEETVTKNGQTFVRKMSPDKDYVGPNGETFSLSGRSLLFVRNVGHLMTSPAILDADGNEVPEGILDAIFTVMAALPDLQKDASSRYKNTRTGSIYIVKPKMHGPEEVAFADAVFAAVEDLLTLPRNTLKIGIMDEERRTSLNLSACIQAAKSRVVFINTGFLDRTGDEIHTSMEAGAFAPKDQIKSMPWIQAYETSNVAAGLQCGLSNKAQIGKGMWAMPDNMAAMMKAKIAQPMAGATTAWVPSPTAASLHALHYHQVNVAQQQEQLMAMAKVDIDTILQIPLLPAGETLTNERIQREIENNTQGILGYVVRWIDQGIGCSKVPDINNVGLMEDRATLRISSQNICNWLHHGICTESQVLQILAAMAEVVDQQNSHDKSYTPMSPDLDNSVAFQAAKDLIFKGRTQPSGYTEPLLHAYRLAYKQKK